MSRFHEKPFEPAVGERQFIVPAETLHAAAEALWDVIHPRLHPDMGLRNQMITTVKIYEAMVQHIMNVAFQNATLVPVAWINQVRDEVATLRAALKFNGIDQESIATAPVPDAIGPLVVETRVECRPEPQAPVYVETAALVSQWSPLGLNNDVFV